MASFISKINRMRNNRLHMANEYFYPTFSMYHEIVQGIPWSGGVVRTRPKRVFVATDKFLSYVIKRRPQYKDFPWAAGDAGGVYVHPATWTAERMQKLMNANPKLSIGAAFVAADKDMNKMKADIDLQVALAREHAARLGVLNQGVDGFLKRANVVYESVYKMKDEEAVKRRRSDLIDLCKQCISDGIRLPMLELYNSTPYMDEQIQFFKDYPEYRGLFPPLWYKADEVIKFTKQKTEEWRRTHRRETSPYLVDLNEVDDEAVTHKAKQFHRRTLETDARVTKVGTWPPGPVIEAAAQNAVPVGEEEEGEEGGVEGLSRRDQEVYDEMVRAKEEMKARGAAVTVGGLTEEERTKHVLRMKYKAELEKKKQREEEKKGVIHKKPVDATSLKPGSGAGGLVSASGSGGVPLSADEDEEGGAKALKGGEDGKKWELTQEEESGEWRESQGEEEKDSPFFSAYRKFLEQNALKAAKDQPFFEFKEAELPNQRQHQDQRKPHAAHDLVAQYVRDAHTADGTLDAADLKGLKEALSTRYGDSAAKEWFASSEGGGAFPLRSQNDTTELIAQLERPHHANLTFNADLSPFYPENAFPPRGLLADPLLDITDPHRIPERFKGQYDQLKQWGKQYAHAIEDFAPVKSKEYMEECVEWGKPIHMESPPQLGERESVQKKLQEKMNDPKSIAGEMSGESKSWVDQLKASFFSETPKDRLDTLAKHVFTDENERREYEEMLEKRHEYVIAKRKERAEQWSQYWPSDKPEALIYRGPEVIRERFPEAYRLAVTRQFEEGMDMPLHQAVESKSYVGLWKTVRMVEGRENKRDLHEDEWQHKISLDPHNYPSVVEEKEGEEGAAGAGEAAEGRSIYKHVSED